MLKITNTRLQEEFFENEKELDADIFTVKTYLHFDNIHDIAENIVLSNRDITVEEGKKPLVLVLTDDKDNHVEMVKEDEHIHVKSYESALTPLGIEKYSEYIKELMQTIEFKHYELVGIIIADMFFDFEDCIDLGHVFDTIPIIVGDSAFL